MKIEYMIPYDLKKNIGKGYNQCMKMVDEDDYVCFVDGDTMFLTNNYGEQIHRIVSRYGSDAIYTCLTNRVGNRTQLYKGRLSDNPNISMHRKLAQALQTRYNERVKELTDVISGHLMIVPKKIWNKVKFDEKGLLGVDNKFSAAVLKSGYKIYLMKGVYIFHYYRLLEGRKYKDHLR